MKKLATAIAAIAMIGTPAFAADMPVKAPPPPPVPSYNWTGAYFGANLGYGWGNDTVNYSPNDPVAAEIFSIGGTLFFGQQPAVSSYDVHQKGVVGGFEGGYNWQARPNWLWGLEADFSFSSMKGQASGTSLLFSIPVPPFFLTNRKTRTGMERSAADWAGSQHQTSCFLAPVALLMAG
jgi:opacity protein-like surface antigen